MDLNNAVREASFLVEKIENARDLFDTWKIPLVESEVKFRVEALHSLMIIALNDAREMLKTWKKDRDVEQAKATLEDSEK